MAQAGDRSTRVSVGEFVNQVRAETGKVSWPSARETRTTTIFVILLTTILALFFFGVDAMLGWGVRGLLDLLG